MNSNLPNSFHLKTPSAGTPKRKHSKLPTDLIPSKGKHSRLSADVLMGRSLASSRRQSAEIYPLPKIETALERRLSLGIPVEQGKNYNFKSPKPSLVGRVLETIMAEESEIQALKDVEYERKVQIC
jgi:hypothetical protein